MNNTVTLELGEYEELSKLKKDFDAKVDEAAKAQFDAFKTSVLHDRDELVRENEKLRTAVDLLHQELEEATNSAIEKEKKAEKLRAEYRHERDERMLASSRTMDEACRWKNRGLFSRILNLEP